MYRLNLYSIRQRLTISLVVGAIGLATLVSVSIWWVIKGELQELMDHGLEESAELIHNVLVSVPDPINQQKSTRIDVEYAEHLIWQLVDVDTGKVVKRSSKAPEQSLKKLVHADIQSSEDGSWRLVTMEFRHSKSLLLVVAQSEEERHEALMETFQYTLAATLFACALGILAMNWRMRVELLPLQRLSQAVRHYDPLIPKTEPVSTGRTELQPIENAIQDLGQRLGQRIMSEQAFTAHAAHALRTPVAGIDAQLALAIREAPDSLQPRLERARAAANRLGRVMQALLSMFRSGLEPQRVQITLTQLLEPLSVNDLNLNFDRNVSINIDPDLLAPVLFNLLDNAQRHHAQTVNLTVTKTDQLTRIAIEDDGEGCPANIHKRMREALDQQDYGPESGFKGLGLILADLVMRAHGGHLHLVDCEHGFALELVWPNDSSRTLN